MELISSIVGIDSLNNFLSNMNKYYDIKQKYRENNKPVIF